MTEKEKVLKYLIDHGGRCRDVSCTGKETEDSIYANHINNEVCPIRFYCIKNRNHKEITIKMREREILAKELLEQLNKFEFLENLK